MGKGTGRGEMGRGRDRKGIVGTGKRQARVEVGGWKTGMGRGWRMGRSYEGRWEGGGEGWGGNGKEMGGDKKGSRI